MNYDAQQYAFTHGLATTPQLHLQQQQQHFQQQHHIFQQQQHQQQYSQTVPTSNVYHFQFGGAGSPANRVLQHKDVHSVGMSANMQQPGVATHGFVQQPFIKQAVPVAFDGNSVVVGSLNGMIYSQQKSHVKNLPDLEGRLMPQMETEVAMQQGLVGVDMMATPNFTEQNVDVLQQQQQLVSGMRVAGQHIFYDKSNCSGWIQPSQMSSPGGTHQKTVCQSTLPSFSHVWSQFSHQKQIDHLQQHKHIQQYHSQQQLQHPFQQQQQQHIQAQRQQHIQAQRQQHIQVQRQFTTDPTFQTLPGIQVIKMQQQQQQKPQQIPIPVQTSGLPQQFNCFSVSQPSLFSTSSVCKEAPQTGKGMQFVDRDVAVQAHMIHSQSSSQSSTPYSEHHPATAVTYTVSGPPKFTVTLDSLTHSETFSLNHFPDRSDGNSPSSNVKCKPVKVASGSAPSVALDNCPLQPQQEWQVPQQQGRLPKPFLHTSSMGSSFERCSSESSSFSSPPYTFTPPSSVDLMFSPDNTHLSKTASESSLSSSSSSGRTSTLSSSSSSFISSSSSSSPPANIPMWPGIQSTDAIVPTVTTASSVASSTCTTSTATVVFSCSTAALATTSVTSTTPNPAEKPSRVHSSLLSGNSSYDRAVPYSLCSNPASRSLAATVNTVKQIQVPYSWHRTCENGLIVYVSPSGMVLHSLEQICGYLLSDNTCKCGLECPIQLEECFSFDPHVESQPWTPASGSEHLANLCNHRREVVALAAFHSSQARASVRAADVVVEKVKKRQHNKPASAEGLIVAPLKKLKTSITNAVNRHAVSMGHFHKPETFSLQPDSHTTSSVVGNCNSLFQGQLKPSVFDSHRSRPHMDNEEMLSPSVQQHPGDQVEIKPLHQQQLYNGQQVHQVDHGHHAFMPAEGHLMFRQGPRKESVTMSSHYSLGPGLQSSKLQPTASQLSHRHKQSANLEMFFPQSPVYPHLPTVTQHRPPGYHSAVWKDESAPAVVPHSHSPRPYQANINFQHSHCDRPMPGAFLKHPTADQPSLGHPSLVDVRKGKSKRPKSKKEKQKHVNGIVDRSSPCSKALLKMSKVGAVPSTSASFFGNPIVFVEQQTAIINNSIASCHIACSSPSPPQCDKSATYRPAKDIANRTSMLHIEAGRSVALKDLEKNTSVDKEEEDDQKTATDLDSNKSFSDTTENNDSAYLSQTGSDIDKSDTADGLDSCSETKCTPVTSIYYRDLAKINESRKSIELTHTDVTSPGIKMSTADCVLPQRKHPTKLQPQLNPVSAVGQLSSSPLESQDHTTVVIQKKRAADTRDDLSNQDVERCQKNMPNCLNGDLSHLLASNNWNIPALQQVLAQYSGGEPGKLNSALQHSLSQTLAAGADFPASNLLSAAARAQLHDQQKVHIPSILAHHQLNSPGLQLTNVDNLSASSVSSSLGDLKAASLSPAVGATAAISQSQQIQPSYPHLAKSASLVGNFMQLQQLPSGSFAVNMLLPGNGHGQTFASDPVHTGTLSTDQELKSGQATLMAQGIFSAVSQTGDAGRQVQIPVASVISSSLASNGAQCSPDGNTMLLNNLSPRMIVNAAMPPVPVSIVTNVTQSLTPQVVPAISLKQTMFGSQHMLSTQHTGAQILGAGPAGTHIINTSPQATQLVTAAQGRQFVNPTAPSTQLVGNPPQTSQIVNTLSLQGLSNQLVIAHPMQQVSPSLSQLSPALAAQILASQGHQQLQQMSPSFVHSQLSKPASQNMVASVSLPTLAVTSSSLDSVSGSALINANIHKNAGGHQHLDTLEKTKVSQPSDSLVPLSNSSLYAATSQPVFVIPQPSTNPLMQVLAPTQTLSTATSLPDVHLQQNALSQMFGQSASVDQAQLQSLLAAGCSPLALQHMMNAVSLSGVQQQQLQIVQLQQLMLQQLQNHGQNIQGIQLPLNQTSSPSQTTAVATPAIVSAIVPQQQQGIQLNSVMDLNSLHSCLSPLGQSYQQQHMPSGLTLQQVTSVNSAVTGSVVQNGSVQKLVQTSAKNLQIAHSLQQSVFSDLLSQTSQKPTSDVPAVVSHEPLQPSTALTQQLPTSCPKSAATNSTVVKPCQPAKPKSKSKSKKSENKKSIDPETERNEEDVAATVQQILAQAVQQQRELSLAAKNQPPPAPKSKSKKSQSRSRANQAAKEHDLGRLASISDDVAVLRTDHLTLKELSHPSGVLESHHFTKSSHSDVQSFNIVHSNHKVLAAGGVAAAQGLLQVNTMASGSPGQAGLGEQNLGEASPVGCNTKKSSISLKDHLSFIISKDKDGHSKKLAAASVQPQAKTRGAGANLGFMLQPTAVMVGLTSQPPATVNSDILFHQSKI